jgi:hypothetical protein
LDGSESFRVFDVKTTPEKPGMVIIILRESFTSDSSGLAISMARENLSVSNTEALLGIRCGRSRMMMFRLANPFAIHSMTWQY